jgi:hypothetical protein
MVKEDVNKPTLHKGLANGVQNQTIPVSDGLPALRGDFTFQQ